VARFELLERPVGGAYQLDLETPPEVRLDRIDRLQVLAQTNYWIQQR
jgi:hypothetical protein